jgi:hypothetical protein
MPPVVESAHVKPEPRVTAENFTRLTTRTGTLLLFLVPSPSWPCGLLPQQYTSPSVVTPQACEVPAEMDEKLRPPATGAGLKLQGLVWQLAWPKELRTPIIPQQYPLCVAVTPHVWRVPALSCTNVKPTIGVGSQTLGEALPRQPVVVGTVPSLPSSFRPQQYATP